MHKACYAQQMRDIDKKTIDLYRIPGIVLMENAALSCIDAIKDSFSLKNLRVCVICGKGNNGGDGFAVARHLYNAGPCVKIILVNGSDFAGDAKINLDIAESMDIPVEDSLDTDEITHIIRESDIVVDAIFGTGIKGEITGFIYDVIKSINENARFVLSVDVPSGIDSDTGEVVSIAVKATKTVTFGAYKVGMFLYPAADYCGEITVAPISIPECVIDEENININVTDDSFVRSVIKSRHNNSHKGDYGRLLIIAGSQGMSGAAYLSAQSALKSGAGLITIACPRCINDALESKTTEVMTMPLDDSDGALAYSSISEILKKVQESDAVLIGPGLGRGDDVCRIVGDVLLKSTVPVIVDADALYAVSQNKDKLKDCRCELIFTPHAMEMSRLTGLSVNHIENNRLDVSREFSNDSGAVLLLKGHHTVVTSPSLVQYINNTGNPGMATAGSGDVLAGIVAAFVAKGMDCTDSAVAGAYIHGLAGDICAKRIGMECMSATDIITSLGDAFCRILQVDKTNILC